MKKLGKLFSMFMLSCALTFAAGCGTDKNVNQDDMADNNAGQNDYESQVDGNDTQMGTEAFDSNGAADDALTENGIGMDGTSGTAGQTDNMTGAEGDRMDNVNGATSDQDAAGDADGDIGNAADDMGNTADSVIDDVGSAAGNMIDDAGNAVGNVVEDIGDGIDNLTDSKNNGNK